LISPTFYKQLFCAQIQEGKKDLQLDCIFALLGSVGVKAVQKNVGENDPYIYK